MKRLTDILGDIAQMDRTHGKDMTVRMPKMLLFGKLENDSWYQEKMERSGSGTGQIGMVPCFANSIVHVTPTLESHMIMYS